MRKAFIEKPKYNAVGRVPASPARPGHFKFSPPTNVWSIGSGHQPATQSATREIHLSMNKGANESSGATIDGPVNAAVNGQGIDE